MAALRIGGAALLLLAAVACVESDHPGEPSPDPGARAPQDPGEVLRFSCGADAHSFSPELLDQPALAELDPHPSARALVTFLAAGHPETEFLPRQGWLLAGRDDRSASFVARVAGDPPLVEVQLERDADGWRVTGWGQCRPRAVFRGLNGATWTLDPDLPAPGPQATEIRALVTETECASGRPSVGRVLPPVILYGADEVTVIFAVRPLPGDAFDCPGNPATPMLIVLEEPLGERRLLDGGVFPPRDASEPLP